MTGSMVALVTPFKGGEIDGPALRDLVEFQISNGTDVLVPCGTTGESATMTHEEHVKVIRLVVDAARTRVPVLAGTGSNCTKEAIDLTRRAKEAGADAALLITPYYNRPPQRCLEEHFRAVADHGGLPIVIYNVPARTGCNILPETVGHLSHHPGIVGLKDAAGDLKQTADTLALVAKDFVLLSGEDFITLPILSVGGKGTISVVANIAPAKCKRLVQSFMEGKVEEARRIHYELLPLCNACFIPGEVNPIGVKTALAEMGMMTTEMRLPLSPMTGAKLEMLRELLKKAALERT